MAKASNPNPITFYQIHIDDTAGGQGKLRENSITVQDGDFIQINVGHGWEVVLTFKRIRTGAVIIHS